LGSDVSSHMDEPDDEYAQNTETPDELARKIQEVFVELFDEPFFIRRVRTRGT
jgi:hypothetical protein